jgi:D-sedoheptulose 7-phosphate isomerase
LKKLINSYLNEMAEPNVKVEDIEKVAKILLEAWIYNKQVFTCGNGGSASTASHFTSDLLKVGVKSYCLNNDNISRLTAITNDSGWEQMYVEQLEGMFNPGDVIVGFSVHGGVGEDKAGEWSQNLLKAIDFAKTHGGKSVGIVGFEGGVMRKICNASVKINVLSTPIVESWHLGIAHLLCELLRTSVKLKMCLDCNRIQFAENVSCIGCGGNKFARVAGSFGNTEDLERE